MDRHVRRLGQPVLEHRGAAEPGAVQLQSAQARLGRVAARRGRLVRVGRAGVLRLVAVTVPVGIALDHGLHQQLTGRLALRGSRRVALDQRRRVQVRELVAALVVDHARRRRVEGNVHALLDRDPGGVLLDLAGALERDGRAVGRDLSVRDLSLRRADRGEAERHRLRRRGPNAHLHDHAVVRRRPRDRVAGVVGIDVPDQRAGSGHAVDAWAGTVGRSVLEQAAERVARLAGGRQREQSDNGNHECDELLCHSGSIDVPAPPR
jgi:hypothetical protein